MSNNQAKKQLTPEELRELATLKSIAEFEEFIAEKELSLSVAEKVLMLEYFETGKLPLSDEQLEDVAGGFSFPFPFY